MDYLTHWKLTEKPFEEVCNPRFFFESEDHREALDRMLYVVNDRNMNMGLLTGEVGSGKTLTKLVLQGSLPPQEFEVIGFENSYFSFTDLLYEIVTRLPIRDSRSLVDAALGQPKREDKYQLVSILKKKLDALVFEEKRHLVLIFDEAQQIDDAVLDELKNLTNIASHTSTYLTIFFVGQPELREKVRRIKPVDQRIFLRFHLNTLGYNDTVKYVNHRLRIAGRSDSGPFSGPALEKIFRGTDGVPREINRVCKLALNHCFAHEATEVGADEIQMIMDDLIEHRA